MQRGARDAVQESAQRRTFAQFLVGGKISDKTFEEWNRECEESMNLVDQTQATAKSKHFSGIFPCPECGLVNGSRDACRGPSSRCRSTKNPRAPLGNAWRERCSGNRVNERND
jgi:hypothetical protein